VFQEGAQPFVPAMPGDPQALEQGTTLQPFLPLVPLQLPPKWKSAKDAEGRTYYYHVKSRVSQWEPPLWVPTLPQAPESESSSDTSDDDEDDESDSSEEDADDKVTPTRNHQKNTSFLRISVRFPLRLCLIRMNIL